jgi:fructokinase
LVQRSERSRDTLERLLEMEQRALKFLDINLRKDCYSLKTIISGLETADILKLNQQELVELMHLLEMPLRSLTEDAGDILRQWRLQSVLVTLGEKGLYAVSSNGQQAYDPGYRVSVVDTVGSGDACAAAFVHYLLQGRSLQECCRFGNLLGALAATKPGGTAPVQPMEIERLAGGSYERIAAPELADLRIKN